MVFGYQYVIRGEGQPDKQIRHLAPGRNVDERHLDRNSHVELASEPAVYHI